VLEDWFYSGPGGRHVMSVNASGQGVCLPPMVQGLQETWPSEGVLVDRLRAARGDKETVDIFEAHRHAYIGSEDFGKVAGLGIETVRIPIPWQTFADALEDFDPKAYGSGAKIVPDPFYKKASFVVVDRVWLASVLRQAAAHGLQVLLDIHMMPGGSSDGTYNGVWPMPPRFWNANVTDANGASLPLEELGHKIANALIKWVEGLGETDRRTVKGLTLMNEPAHMASIDRRGGTGFIRSEEQVLAWLAKAADAFRRSTLPSQGVKLYVNMIETTFDDFAQTVPRWWSQTFSVAERTSWAVIDVHWYTAWSGGICSGRVLPTGKYLCDQPVEELRPILRGCAETYAKKFAWRFGDDQKACTEFSLGTYEDALLACNDVDLLRMFLEEQLAVFAEYGIEAFFWTWRMPYGPTFQRGWSLKFISGLERLPPPQVCERLSPRGTFEL